MSNNPNLNQPASGQPSVFGTPPPGSFGQSPNIAGQFGMIDLTTPTYYVQAVGAGNRLYSVGELQQMAKSKIIKSETSVQHMSSNYPVQVKTVPGVFRSGSGLQHFCLVSFLVVWASTAFILATRVLASENS